jgi:hypothetical protein
VSRCQVVTRSAARLLVLGLAVAAMQAQSLYGSEEPATPRVAPSAAIPLRAAHTSGGAQAGIWFHPLPGAAAWPNGPGDGERDFMALWEKHAAWPRAMAHVGVVGMYAAWITAVGDEELHAVVAFLKAHHMGIEIEAPALQAPEECGSGVEGYVPWGMSLHDFTLAYLERLKAEGAQVPFVKVDEPFFFGTVTGDPRACHWPMAEVALAVGQYAQLVHTVYPDAAVGDVEPIIDAAYPPGVVTAMAEWHETYQAVTGAPFPFFFADIDFSNAEWPTIVKTLEEAAHQRAMPFGIIYIGDQLDASDGEWAAKAVARFQTYQGEYGGRPDYVLFQSWQPHPRLCLPESDPTTFTGVLDAYVTATAGNGGRP